MRVKELNSYLVYDLEKHEQLDNPSFYSYEAVVESFLDTDMYSAEIKRKMMLSYPRNFRRHLFDK